MRSTTNTGRRVLMQPLEIPHQSFSRRRWHASCSPFSWLFLYIHTPLLCIFIPDSLLLIETDPFRITFCYYFYILYSLFLQDILYFLIFWLEFFSFWKNITIIFYIESLRLRLIFIPAKNEIDCYHEYFLF